MPFFRKFLVSSLLIILFIQNALASEGGSYTSAPSKRMDLSSVNHWFTYTLPITKNPARGATITKIFYQYALGQKNIREGTLVVNLCSIHSSRCVDISNSESGETVAFRGESALSQFIIYYKVVNHRSIGLVTSKGPTLITVNWTTNK
ncbi:flagellar protein FlhE [Dryocola clanedunensis]|uniref:flagellar protein FlhE n=1 Tax=Dryocola clanedunensis TaxID=2925396 RepID=UPI0038CC0D1F